MSIKTRWMNPEHTVILISYQGEIEEREFVAIMNHVHKKIDGTAYPIHIVHDYSSSNINELLNGKTYPRSGSGALVS